MPESHPQSISRVLAALRAGEQGAFDELLPFVYDELHGIAARERRRWEGDETLNTTALVNEAYLRLVDQSAPDWRSRAHFMAVAATAMRQILIDYAKRKRAAKRGGGQPHLALHDLEAALHRDESASGSRDEVLLALDEALNRLQQRDLRQARIVECRFFGGMSIADTGEALGVSPATVKRGWAMAQAWLYRELRRRAEGDRE
jgi:RNA polymerase sigma factor (TIGR02999 family)